MQNHLLAILQWILRIVRLTGQQAGEAFVLLRRSTDPERLGVLGVSVDIDSARLDAVSRSVLWGSGMLCPGSVPAPAGSPWQNAGVPPVRHPARRHLRFDR